MALVSNPSCPDLIRLDPGIHDYVCRAEDVDGRIKPGHDDLNESGSKAVGIRPDNSHATVAA